MRNYMFQSLDWMKAVRSKGDPIGENGRLARRLLE